MVFHKTSLSVIDNSGVKYVKCLKVIKAISSGGKKQVATVGNIILCSVKVSKPLQKIKKGDLFKSLIVCVNRRSKRFYGLVRFYKNSVILLNNKLEPLGNRVFGPMLREAIEQNFVKLSSIKISDL